MTCFSYEGHGLCIVQLVYVSGSSNSEAPAGINGGEGEKEVEPGGVGQSWSHKREEETEEIIMTPIREHLIICAKRIIVSEVRFLLAGSAIESETTTTVR
jgi:hypothetical protein